MILGSKTSFRKTSQELPCYIQPNDDSRGGTTLGLRGPWPPNFFLLNLI